MPSSTHAGTGTAGARSGDSGDRESEGSVWSDGWEWGEDWDPIEGASSFPWGAGGLSVPEVRPSSVWTWSSRVAAENSCERLFGAVAVVSWLTPAAEVSLRPAPGTFCSRKTLMPTRAAAPNAEASRVVRRRLRPG